MAEGTTCETAESRGTHDRRPRIGLTTYWQHGEWGVWSDIAAIVPGNYVRAVVAAGGTPVLLPPVGTDVTVLEVLDGLIVIGGVDVDPSRYGQDPHPRTAPQPERDEHDTALIRCALERAMPLFAICRGAQVLNVALGGTLHQHVPDLIPDAGRYQPSPGVFGEVEFSVAPDTLTADLLGPRASAPCYHHQSLDRLGRGLRAASHAEDGTVETVELPEAPGWVLGTQFHPEENLEDLRLFRGFVAAAGDHMTTPDRRVPAAEESHR
ncbi:gamma-glutamyl-gamma-aminobutyrate hydrolase family protein [Nesterenkonia marinintestina]|uniref:gamma-glutamyl-gamma-aminobutyrate hydrolase family protein n=1 Tax=Nesterenkonia marinintestina TaxID=2979865 RepID=UPI0021BF6418|nr:gamma-glutamyl-gamma-aminobutyrate hydrolase family protein [Nesterenkonia sp. GX14115]